MLGISQSSSPLVPPTAEVPLRETLEPDAGAATSAIHTDAFRALTAAKVRLVAPLLGGSLAFILGMTLLAGYGRSLLALKVAGAFNLGYLLVLLTYIICWAVAVAYVVVANRSFEALSQRAADDSGAGSDS